MTTPFDCEVALLSDWQQGDRRAGLLLYTRYNRSVQRFFINKTRGEAESADLVHDTFIALQRAAKPTDSTGVSSDDAPLCPFILGVAHNVFRNHIRNVARRARRELDLGIHALGEIQPGASSILRARKQAQALMDGLRAIPIDDQILLELKYFERQSFQQIAAVLDVPVTSLNGRISRAKQRLVQQVKLHVDGELKVSSSDALEEWAAEVRIRLTKCKKTVEV